MTLQYPEWDLVWQCAKYITANYIIMFHFSFISSGAPGIGHVTMENVEDPFKDMDITIPDIAIPEPFQPSSLDHPPNPKKRRLPSPVEIHEASCSYVTVCGDGA